MAEMAAPQGMPTDPVAELEELFRAPEGQIAITAISELVTFFRSQWKADLYEAEERLYKHINQSLNDGQLSKGSIVAWLGLFIAAFAAIPGYLQLRSAKMK